MGRAAKMKRLRKIVEGLPGLKVNAPSAETVLGAELIQQGITEINGQKVYAKNQYKRNITVNQPINHERNLKRMYKQFGEKGFDVYVNAVENHVEQSGK